MNQGSPSSSPDARFTTHKKKERKKKKVEGIVVDKEVHFWSWRCLCAVRRQLERSSMQMTPERLGRVPSG
jgi:hypothetical protein